MNTVISQDGTTIAYDRSGDGPALILVGGAFQYRAFDPRTGQLAELLAPHFTVYHYDRRGRGDSGDIAPYAVEREIEDLAALVEAAGGSAYLFGMSSGAPLALDAVAHGLPITKLVVYEAPFIVDDSRPPISIWGRVSEAVAAGRRGDAVRIFMKAVEVPAFFIALMRVMPVWSKLKAVAHTLPYDGAIVQDNQRGQPLPARRWASVTIPTLVLDGGKSPVWMRHAMRSLATVLPNARYLTLDGQTHMVKAPVHAPALVEFFTG
jgi:pimeloyl-ACP methyl ester carboxylesterase